MWEFIRNNLDLIKHYPKRTQSKSISKLWTLNVMEKYSISIRIWHPCMDAVARQSTKGAA